MAETIDASALGQLAVQVGLIAEPQLLEARDELGNGADNVFALVRHLERKRLLTPWQSSKLMKSDRDGFFLGGYRILYKIASGSFGRVFRADDPQTGTIVAIKVLRRRWSDNPHNIELFEREAKVGMALRHPNIVSILNVGRDPLSSQYYIIMEFVEGGNLRDFLAIRKKLEAAEALRILEDAVNGLAYAYSRGITHRDIKLTNILVSTQGVAKLVDFGLAGLTAPQGFGRDETEQVDRTVDYAGLEKATNVKPGDVRSDIFFLGCVLFEVLIGRSPLQMTKDKFQRMQKERFEKVTPIQPGEISGPPAVERLVQTMISLNPRLRYQTPAQLLEAIRATRRELDRGGAADGQARAAERSVFVVERNGRLQEGIREKLKEHGFRVYIAADPGMALTRYRQQPYHALVIDTGSVGEEGLHVFDRVLTEARRLQLDCAGILLLDEDQADWMTRIHSSPRVVAMVRPGITFKSLHQKLEELLPKA